LEHLALLEHLELMVERVYPELLVQQGPRGSLGA